jgi:hypothetical protein
MFLLNNSTYQSRDSSVDIAVELEYRCGQEIFLLYLVSRSTLVPTESPTQCATLALSSAVQRPKREANNSPTYSVEAKNGGPIPALLHTS